ncbi:MAG: hypothetical protein ACJATK_001300, partial [Paracoccaceae bacterium]
GCLTLQYATSLKLNDVGKSIGFPTLIYFITDHCIDNVDQTPKIRWYLV